MLADSSQNTGTGKITDGIEIDDSIRGVIDYIEEYLPIFRAKNKGEVQTAEPTLNERLAIILNRYNDSVPFFFKAEKNQAPHGQTPKTDMGVLSKKESISVNNRIYGEYDAFFEIECKRLPTPKTTHIEYVIGQKKPSGGIERFKKKIHGAKQSYSAIIGYVQKGDFDYWFSAINSLIDELITNEPNFWYKADKLQPVLPRQSVDFAKYTSKNYRGDTDAGNHIHLLHYWVDLVS